jgi:hypothetical protein
MRYEIRSGTYGSFDYRRAPGERAPEWSLALLVGHDGGGVSGKIK